MMQLESPWFLLFLAALPLWLWGKRSFLAPLSMPFPCETLIRNMAGKGRARLAAIPTFFKAAGLLLLVVGLARPVWRAENQSFEREGIDLFLLMDISSSMSDGSYSTRFPPLNRSRTSSAASSFRLSSHLEMPSLNAMPNSRANSF